MFYYHPLFFHFISYFFSERHNTEGKDFHTQTHTHEGIFPTFFMVRILTHAQRTQQLDRDERNVHFPFECTKVRTNGSLVTITQKIKKYQAFSRNSIRDGVKV
jgi:hypothetical protein